MRLIYSDSFYFVPVAFNSMIELQTVELYSEDHLLDPICV